MTGLAIAHSGAGRADPESEGALDVDDLRELMRAFNETTERLESTHVALQREVGRLRGELAEANAQLRRSRSLAALGQMAAGIAHEIRNPLGSIQLYVQMLSEDVADRPDSAELCTKIGRGVVRLDAIVRDVLLFAREMKVQPGPTTAGELVSQALASCEALIEASKVRVQAEVPEGPAGELEADGGLITQALSNVVRNGVEAMVEHESEPRAIDITAARRRVRCPNGRQAQRLVLTVEDSGPGVSREVIERMFNPFFTTRKTGTGLGLAIVHRIVDAHGGHINVKNKPDGGARIELCLPLRARLRRAQPADDHAEIEITAVVANATQRNPASEDAP